MALIESVENDAVPRELAQYRVERLLGRGGMGVVYMARDTRLDRTVALKFLPVYLSSNDAARARLLLEARAAAAVDHVNVGVVHEIAETDAGRVYIAMAYYEGHTLRTAAPAPFPPALDVVNGEVRGHSFRFSYDDPTAPGIGPVLCHYQGAIRVLDGQAGHLQGRGDCRFPGRVEQDFGHEMVVHFVANRVTT